MAGIFFAAILTSCQKSKPSSNPSPNPNPGPVGVLEFSSFAPQRGVVGQVIKLSGKNFSTDKTQNFVNFEGSFAIAEVIEAKTNELSVKVPVTAVTGKISVRVGNKTIVSTADFVVDPELLVNSFTPTSGNAGVEVVIAGANFDGNTTVKLGNLDVTILDRSANSLKVKVPAGLQPGSYKFTITNTVQTKESVQTFAVTESPNYQWSTKLNAFNVDKIYSNATGFVLNDVIYMGLGKDIGVTPNQFNNGFWSYDKTTAQWNAAVQVPSGFTLRERAMSISSNNKVYVGLGLSKNDWWVLESPYDDNSWKSLTPFPLTSQTANAFAFEVNNNLYVGAVNDNGSRPFPTVIYQFRPSDNNGLGSWVEVARIDFAIYFAAPFVIGNDAYIGGDMDQSNNSRPYFKFTPSNNNAVVKVSSLPAASYSTRKNNTFTLNGKGYVLADKKVFEYTPDASGGVWRIALDNANAPEIHHCISAGGKAYGWDFIGNIYEFRL